MAREKLKDFLSKDSYGNVATDRIDYVVDQGGDLSSDPYLDDLDGDLKEALGRYTNYATSTVPDNNQYTISNETSEFSLREDDGTPSHPTTGDGGEDKRYLQDASGGDATIDHEGAKNYFSTISGGGDPRKRQGGTFSAEELGTVIDKSGKAQDLTGHDVNARAAQEHLISPVLATANRFDPGGNTPYMEPGVQSARDVDNLNFASKQGTIGEYHENSDDVKLKEMKGIAEKMLILATGHKVGGEGFAGASPQGLLPSLAQLGSSKVDRSDMYAKNSSDPGFGGSSKVQPRVATKTDTWETKSWGTMNSPLEPFSAIPKMGMTTLTVALVIVIEILIKIVAAIINAFISPVGDTVFSARASERGNAIRKKLKLGTSGDPPMGVLMKPTVFGVTHNANGNAHLPFDDAVATGIQVFFGEIAFSDDGGGGLLSFLPGGANINDSPGYYSIVFRSIIRSTIEIGLAFGRLFKSGNFFAALGAIADVIDTIKNSKLVAYINLLTGLGEIYSEAITNDDWLAGNKISSLDSNSVQYGNQDVRVGRSFYAPRDLADPTDHISLVWGTGQLPSSYLFSLKVRGIAANAGMGSPPAEWVPVRWAQGDFASQGFEEIENYQKIHESPNNRLSSEAVEATETALEGEYVPFYFHDLRTNQIVAFNAFLTSLTDSYSVSYDSTQGYGRADPVMTYNKTQRTIGMSFWIVSTNPNDFDEMWWKINLLTTMIYPQYSAGTSISHKDGNITVPFSQIPTASPVIRIRLGDLIKSNYSRFALARLFGLGEEGNISGSPPPDPIPPPKDVDEKEKEAKTPPLIPLGPPTLLKFEVKQACSATWMKKISLNFLGRKKGKMGKGEIKKKIQIPAGIVIEVDATSLSLDSVADALKSGDIMGLAKYGGAKLKMIDYEETSGVGHKLRNKIRKAKYNSFWLRAALKGGLEEDTEFEVPYELLFNKNYFQLAPGQGEISDAFFQVPTPVDELGFNFLKPDVNPITRAFESTRGRGLAGVVTQMDFNWFDTTWTTDSPGDKAPKSCQVTISFSPMHDIAPGIDHHGMNRGPVYNVGRMSRTIGGDPYDGD